MQMITINALKIRASLGSILDNVSQKGEHYIVERMGKPLAVILPYNKFDFEKNEAEKRQERLGEVAKSMDKWRKKYGSDPNQQNSATIVRHMRDERTKHLLDVVEGRK